MTYQEKKLKWNYYWQNLLIPACKTVFVHINVRSRGFVNNKICVVYKMISFLNVLTGLVAATGAILAWNLLVLILLQFISSHKEESRVPENTKTWAQCMVKLNKTKQLINEYYQSWICIVKRGYLGEASTWKNSSFWLLSPHQYLGCCPMLVACDATTSLQLDE